MKKWLKILIGIISVPIIVIVIFFGYYLIANLQGKIEAYQVGDPGAEHRILIASQGSEFKEKLLSGLVTKLKSNERYLSIVDCTDLQDERLDIWDACVIIHTTQIHGMPKAAEAFLNVSTDLSNVVLVTTSGGGDEEVKNYKVDAISSASRLNVTHHIIEELNRKLDVILEKQEKIISDNINVSASEINIDGKHFFYFVK